jgi:hypothetical protein
VRRRTLALLVAAVVAVPIAIGLAVLAVDVMRVPGELARRDTRFESAPERQAGLWGRIDFLKGWPAIRILGVHDDLDYRRAAGLYVRAEPGKFDYAGFPDRELLRSRAQYRLTRVSSDDPDPHRRAQMLVLFGVMTLDTRATSAEVRDNLIRDAANAFRAALDLDPTNEDAKFNLELVLSLHGPVALPGNAPGGGQDQGQISGRGQTGGGY